MLRQKDVIKTLCTKYPLYNFQVRSNNKRLGNLDNISIEIIVKCIFDTFNPSYIETLHPKHPRNPSQKYQCILFTVDSEIFTVISCTYENKGKIFEDDLYSLLSAKDPSVDALLKYLNIQGDYKVLNTGKTNTARNVYSRIHDCGEIISDITIIEPIAGSFMNNKEHYLSLKAKNGKTLYSGKQINFIFEDNDRIDFDDDKFMTSPHGKLFEMLDIDVYKVIQGLNSYKSKDTKFIHTEPAPNTSYDFIRKLLINSWSYGYHLIYEHKGTVDALDLTNINSTIKMIDGINSINITYPTYKSKQLTVTISVENKLVNTTDTYTIEFRNTKGKILPLEMKVRKM